MAVCAEQRGAKVSKKEEAEAKAEGSGRASGEGTSASSHPFPGEQGTRRPASVLRGQLLNPVPWRCLHVTPLAL